MSSVFRIIPWESACRRTQPLLDFLAASGVMAPVLVYLVGKSALRGRRGRSSVKLLTLEADYSLTTIRRLGLEHLVTSRDLDGFFEQVWTVHPAVGASPDEPPEEARGAPRVTRLTPRHTMIEGTVGYFRGCRPFPMFNFAAAQAALLLELDRLIARERIPVIRASDPFFLGPIGLFLSRLHGVPLVIRLIANYDGNFYKDGRPAYPRLFRTRSVERKVARFVLARADLVAAGNEDILGYALANGARPGRTTTFLVGNLIDPVHFETEPADRGCVRGELGLEDRPFITCLGRLEPDKHPEDVVAVLAAARGRTPTLAAVLVGEGSLRNDLEAMARDLGVDDALVFAGNRDQKWVAAALASASVVVSPVTGRALVEAMLSGTPVVAYDVDWQGELVDDGETGVLVPYRDTEKMAEAVCRLVEERPLAASFGERARSKALRVMDPHRLMRHEQAEYEKLLADGRL